MFNTVNNNYDIATETNCNIPGITDTLMGAAHKRTTLTNMRAFLRNIVAGRFKWSGNVVNLEYAEIYALATGGVSIAETDEYGAMLAPFVNVGGYNVFGYPKAIRQWNFWGVPMKETENFCVMYDNVFRYPNIANVLEYADTLTKIKNTLGACLNILKTGYAVISPQTETDLSMASIANQLDQNNGFIFLRDKSILENLQVIPMANNSNFINVYQLYQQMLNTFLNMQGINSNPETKRERNVKDEINTNNDLISKTIEQWYKPRRDFCEKVNKMFPEVNLHVELNDDYKIDNGVLTETGGAAGE